MLAKEIYIFLYYAESHPYIHQSIPSPLCLNVDTSKKFYGSVLSKLAHSLLQLWLLFFHNKNRERIGWGCERGMKMTTEDTITREIHVFLMLQVSFKYFKLSEPVRICLVGWMAMHFWIYHEPIRSRSTRDRLREALHRAPRTSERIEDTVLEDTSL